GMIFRWYRATLLADDDEVAVAMGPIEIGAPALSEALINIRVTFARARATGILSRSDRHRLLEIARRIHFRDRSYDVILDHARSDRFLDHLDIDRLRKWILNNRVNQKQIDAEQLLRYLARVDMQSPHHSHASPPPFTFTEAWLTDLDQSGF